MGITPLDLVLWVFAFAGIFPTLLGVLTIFFWIKPKKAPVDESNRINSIRLWWFALTRPELFVAQFPWLQNDELDNVK